MVKYFFLADVLFFLGGGGLILNLDKHIFPLVGMLYVGGEGVTLN